MATRFFQIRGPDAPTPFEKSGLAATGSGQVIALYLFACAIVSVIATAALPSNRDRDFARDHR